MFLQAFSEHILHVVGGGAVVAVLIFGLIGILIFLDKRGRKTRAKQQGRNVQGQTKATKKGSRPKKRVKR